jgi:hypothetical protein
VAYHCACHRGGRPGGSTSRYRPTTDRRSPNSSSTQTQTTTEHPTRREPGNQASPHARQPQKRDGRRPIMPTPTEPSTSHAIRRPNPPAPKPIARLQLSSQFRRIAQGRRNRQPAPLPRPSLVFRPSRIQQPHWCDFAGQGNHKALAQHQCHARQPLRRTREFKSTFIQRVLARR